MQFRNSTQLKVKFLFIIAALALCLSANAQVENIIEGDVIVKLDRSIRVDAFCEEFNQEINGQINLRADRALSKSVNMWLLKYDFESQDAERILTQIRGHENVLIAQHNHTNITLRTTTPNDTQFGSQYAHQNTGQSGGTVGADMDTPEAWDITTGGTTTQGDEIVVAVVDGGFQLNHPDLSPNLWVNVDEIPGNGIDDDNNGYIDDINGWDAFGNDGTIPSDNHGTHVAGIVGAKGNNNQGVSGINWDVKLMMVAGSSGNESTVVAAYGYILDERTLYNNTGGAEGSFVVSTNSSFGVDFGDPANFPLWCAMYDDLGMQGIISATATANQNINVDNVGDVPTTCTSSYMIGVTNTTDDDVKNNGAAFGTTHIDLGAPGTSVLSTTLGGNYGNLTGTSMATPQVAGTVALLMSAACDNFITDYKNDPATFALELRDAILNGVDPLPNLNGITATGGRLNVFRAIEELNPGPGGTCTADFMISSTQSFAESCSPADANYTVDVTEILGFSDPVTLSVTGNPAGSNISLATNPVTPGNSTVITVSNLAAVAAGTYTLTVSGMASTGTKTLDFDLLVESNTPGAVSLSTPADGTMNTTTDPAFTWIAAADASTYTIDIGSDAGFTNIVETGTSDTESYSPANALMFSTTYYWRVTPANSCGAGQISSTFSFTTEDVTFCTASGDDASEEWIESIEVAGVSNITGTDGGYGDYTSVIIDMQVGQSVDFTLTPEWDGNQFDEYWVIWIDYNNNGDFTDAGELVFDAGSANQNIQTGSFTIPSGTHLGQVRMRIVMRYNTQPSSCGNFNFGEVEDYTVDISNPENCLTSVVETDTYASGTTQVFESDNFINSYAKVALGANITYDAADCVELLNDFEVASGGIFEALIEGCGGATTLQEESENSEK